VTGGWRRLHNEELHNLCSSPNIIRVMKLRGSWAGNVAHVREMRAADEHGSKHSGSVNSVEFLD
jgi:hypothetical protein